MKIIPKYLFLLICSLAFGATQMVLPGDYSNWLTQHEFKKPLFLGGALIVAGGVALRYVSKKSQAPATQTNPGISSKEVERVEQPVPKLPRIKHEPVPNYDWNRFGTHFTVMQSLYQGSIRKEGLRDEKYFPSQWLVCMEGIATRIKSEKKNTVSLVQDSAPLISDTSPQQNSTIPLVVQTHSDLMVPKFEENKSDAMPDSLPTAVGDFNFIQESELTDSVIGVDPLGQIKDACMEVFAACKERMKILDDAIELPFDKSLAIKLQEASEKILKLKTVQEDVIKGLYGKISSQAEKNYVNNEIESLTNQIPLLVNFLMDAKRLVADSECELIQIIENSFQHLDLIKVGHKEIYKELNFGETIPDFKTLQETFAQLSEKFPSNTNEGARYRQLEFSVRTLLGYLSYNAWLTKDSALFATLRINREVEVVVDEFIEMLLNWKLYLLNLKNDLQRLTFELSLSK